MEKMKDFTVEHMTEFFEYLDDLRERGEINMFSARTYLADEFDMAGDLAGKVVAVWMATFDPDKSAIARADESTVNEL